MALGIAAAAAGLVIVTSTAAWTTESSDGGSSPAAAVGALTWDTTTPAANQSDRPLGSAGGNWDETSWSDDHAHQSSDENATEAGAHDHVHDHDEAGEYAESTSPTTASPATSEAAATPPPSATPPTTASPTTAAPTTAAPTTAPPTTVPSTTAAPTTTTPAPAGYEARGQAALAAISYPWQQRLPGWTVRFKPGRSGVLGLTFTAERVIEVYVRDDQSDGFLRHVIAHELGHAVDVSLNTGAEREQWLAARGATGAPWWPGNGATDFSTGAGDFAECFAAWQTGSGNFRSNVAGWPTGDQLNLLAQLAAG